MSSQIKIVGIEQVKRNFNTLTAALDPLTERILKAVANEVKEEARELVPVDTGALRKSIRVTSTAKEAGKTTRVGVRAGGYETNPKTGHLVNYAIYVEFGTSRQSPQPFLIPAANRKAGPIMRQLLAGLDRTLRGA